MLQSLERDSFTEEVRQETAKPSRSGAALEKFAREYGDASERTRYGLRVSVNEGERSFAVTALGAVRERRYLIVTAPETEQHELIAVTKGQTLVCRWFNASTAYRFRATIVKIAFEPIPLLYLELPARVEHTAVRHLPRALANVRALVRAAWPAEAVVVDLSLGGVRIAVADPVPLDKGSAADLLMWPRLLERDYLLRLNCTVTGVLGQTDRKHPDISFYGLSFNAIEERDELVLHAYVQSCLATEFDWLTQTLSKIAK